MKRLLLGAVASLAFAGAAQAATVTYSTTSPTLNYSQPGYTANGSIVATVANSGGCTGGVFTVNASPIAASGPGGSTPPSTTTTTYIGFPAGNFAFNNAGAGQYTITTTTTSCGAGVPPPNTVDVVTVANTPAPVPTLGEWAMIALFGMLALMAAALIRRRQYV